jgi:hypothetical protein
MKEEAMTTNSSTDLGTTENRTEAMATEARAALRDLGQSMPEVARVSRGLVTDAMRAIEQGSDNTLTAGATLSLGLAAGLLIGGAPRLLILMALAPAAAIGLQMVDRQKAAGPKRSS